jgi:hypothetical protein
MRIGLNCVDRAARGRVCSFAMSIAKQAAAEQVGSGYAVDVWMEMTLEPMTKIWQGVGGHSNFFLSEEDAREARGSYEGTKPYKFAETLWRMAQVEPSVKHGFREEIAEFVVDLPTLAAVGICTANKALGSGSVFQYFIPGWEPFLFRTGRTHKFGAKSY